MPMDGLTLSFVARELADTLVSGRVERVTQPEKDALLLLVRAKGQNHRLLLCASPNCARAHITTRAFQNPVEAPMFCMLMRKHLTGGRITDIRQLDGDRVLAITIDNRDELGDTGERTLYLEIMNRHSNLTLVTRGRIVDAIRHVTDDMSRVRQALPGLPYLPPPAQDKLDPALATARDYREALLAQTGRLDKALAACVRGLSMTAAREIALRLTNAEQAQLADFPVDALADKLAVFFARLPDIAQPTLLVDGEGAALDVFPFVYFSNARERQKPLPTLSAALDAYFGDKDARERITQKSGSMVRLVKNLIERAEKKLALQEDALLSGERMEEYRVCGELLTAHLHRIGRIAQFLRRKGRHAPRRAGRDALPR